MFMRLNNFVYRISSRFYAFLDNCFNFFIKNKLQELIFQDLVLSLFLHYCVYYVSMFINCLKIEKRGYFLRKKGEHFGYFLHMFSVMKNAYSSLYLNVSYFCIVKIYTIVYIDILRNYLLRKVYLKCLMHILLHIYVLYVKIVA